MRPLKAVALWEGTHTRQAAKSITQNGDEHLMKQKTSFAMNENKMKTGIICHECKYENRNHGLKHGLDEKLRTVESFFDSNIEQKTTGNVLNENMRLKTEKKENIIGE